MQVAIVDDDMEFTQKVEEAVRAFYGEAGQAVEVKCFTEGYALLEKIEAGVNHDIYILDVEMPGLDGLGVAHKIREKDEDAGIVILSAFDKYALPAYKVRPYDYIVKQEFARELPAALKGIGKQRQRRAEKDIYIIKEDGGARILRLDEILYLEKEKKKKYTVIHCSDGQEYIEKLALEKIYEKLPTERFIYVNRANIINMKHITCLEKGIVTLAGKIQLSVSRYRIAEVKDELAGYWGEKW